MSSIGIFPIKIIEVSQLKSINFSQILASIMHYYRLGLLPKKRHTQFRKESGELYSEQLFSTEGFSDNYSLLYHNQPPTQIIQISDPLDVSPNVAINKQLSHRSLKGFDIAPTADYLESRKPEELQPIDEKGDFLLYIKKQDQLYPYHYKSHPFDVVGWDGYVYPYAFSIHDFEPITGRVHQPPPVHQTFQTRGFVVCSFVPRLYDYHPLAIPAPYNHSNIDSDEVLYYVDGDFMSRKSVEKGQITLHPGGIPHGPHPGTVEKSIGAKETKELAVMVDTFRPLSLTDHALQIEDTSYPYSWVH